MKIFFKIILISITFISINKLIRTQTDGFRLEKTLADFPNEKRWDVENQNLDPSFFTQPYYFLGSGTQCYAFQSTDRKTVLKIFKHYHMWPRSTLLKKLHFKNIVKSRKKRMESIFSSALIAYRDLKDQTKVFHLKINETKDLYPKITIYDKIGVKHTLDLNKTPFALQKKAKEVLPYLKSHLDEGKEIIDSFLECIKKRSNLGITNSDPIIWKNFGIFDGKIIEIDIGSFSKNYSIKNSRESKKELFFEIYELKNWLNENYPPLESYLDEKIYS